MPITFNEVASLGDPLSVHSYQVNFPTLPNGVDGRSLTYSNASVSLPDVSVAQITVKPFGWSVSFAGRRMQTATFSMEFVDSTDSPIYKSLSSWQRLCSGYKYARARRKADYAVDIECVNFDTTGKVALKNKLFNVWPTRFKIWDSAEEAGPAHVTCDFSVDAMDVMNLNGYDSAEDAISSNYVIYSN